MFHVSSFIFGLLSTVPPLERLLLSFPFSIIKVRKGKERRSLPIIGTTIHFLFGWKRQHQTSHPFLSHISLFDPSFHTAVITMAKKSKAKTKVKPTKKTSEWSSLPWEKIQVTKDGDEMHQNPSRQDSATSEAATFDESKYLSEKNHYDDPRADPKELYDDSRGESFGSEKVVDGANDPGIFFGLEVIDGSQYSVEKVPVYNKHGGNGDKPDGYMTKLVIKDDGQSGEAKQSTSQRKAGESVSSASKTEDDSKGESKSTKESASATNDAEIDMSKLSRKEKNKLKLAKLKARRKEIKLEKKRKREQREAEAESSSSTEDAKNVSKDASESTKPKKKKKRNNKSSDQSAESESSSSSSEHVTITKQCIDSIQNSWCLATGGVYLHEKLCASLYRSGFHSPTPIQGSTLAASILGLRDIVGAAPTGSVRIAHNFVLIDLSINH